jgi:hypothetical protein
MLSRLVGQIGEMDRRIAQARLLLLRFQTRRCEGEILWLKVNSLSRIESACGWPAKIEIVGVERGVVSENNYEKK